MHTPKQQKKKKQKSKVLAKTSKDFSHAKYRSTMVKIWCKAIVMLCPESSLAVKLIAARKKTWNFTGVYASRKVVIVPHSARSTST